MRKIWSLVKWGFGGQSVESDSGGRHVQTSHRGEELPTLPQKLDGSDLGTRGASAGELEPMAQQPAKVEAHASLESATRQVSEMGEAVRGVMGRYEAHVADIAGDARSAEMDRLVSEGRSILEKFDGDLNELCGKLKAEKDPNRFAALQQETDQLAKRIGGGRKNLFKVVTQTCRRRIEEMQTAASAFDSEHGSRVGDLIGDTPSAEVQALVQRHGNISGERREAIEKLSALHKRLGEKNLSPILPEIQREMVQISRQIKDVERELLAMATAIAEASNKLYIQRAEEIKTEANAFDSKYCCCVRDLIGNAPSKEKQALDQAWKGGSIWVKRRNAIKELNPLREKLNGKVSPSELSEIQREMTQISERIKGAEESLLAMIVEVTEASKQLCIQRAEEMQTAAGAFDSKQSSRVMDLIGDMPGKEVKKLAQRHGEISSERRSAIEKLSTLREKLNGTVSSSELSRVRGEMAQVSEQIKGAEQNLLRIARPNELFWRIATDVVDSFNPRGVDGLCAKEVSIPQAHEMHRRLAAAIAATCFDGTGKIDRAQVAMWRDFFAGKENFLDEYCVSIPFFEHMRFQASCVTEHLLRSHVFVDTIEKSNEITLGAHGQAMLAAAGKLTKPGELIFASLLSPQIQMDLPTSSIDSAVNEMIFNRPRQLAEMYASILADGSFRAPSGYLLKLPPIADGHIAVNLEQGKHGRKEVFKGVSSKDQRKVDAQIRAWNDDGITYDSAANRYELGLPARNLNDLCFAGIFQETFGNDKIDRYRMLGTAHILSGFPVGTFFGNLFSKIFKSLFSRQISAANVPNAIAKLQEDARARRRWDNGANYMRMVYECSRGAQDFNVNVAELLALDPNKMEEGEIRSIGALNYTDQCGIDIVRLAVRKIGGKLQFGEVRFAGNWRFGAEFEPINISRFLVHKTEVRQLPTPATPTPAAPKSVATVEPPAE
jgi:predicted  nucleic acid-binding Zn-ribbon protein